MNGPKPAPKPGHSTCGQPKDCSAALEIAAIITRLISVLLEGLQVGARKQTDPEGGR